MSTIASKSKLAIYFDFLVEWIFTFAYLIKAHEKYNLIHIVGDVNITSAALFFCLKKKIPILIEIVNEDPKKKVAYWVRKPFWLMKTKLEKKRLHFKTLNRRLAVEISSQSPFWNVKSWDNPVNYKLCNKIYISKKRKRPSKYSYRILYLAKFIKRKRQNVIIEALKNLPKNVNLTLAGPLVEKGAQRKVDREYFESIKALVNEYDLSSRVNIIAEFIDKPELLYQKADLFVFPSVGEAFGTPILEALACGVPVIANSSEPAFLDWVEDGRNGYFFDGSSVDLTNKINLAMKTKFNFIETRKRILRSASFEVSDRNYLNKFVELARDIKLTD